jgi:hypothetical protein
VLPGGIHTARGITLASSGNTFTTVAGTDYTFEIFAHSGSIIPTLIPEPAASYDQKCTSIVDPDGPGVNETDKQTKHNLEYAAHCRAFAIMEQVDFAGELSNDARPTGCVIQMYEGSIVNSYFNSAVGDVDHEGDVRVCDRLRRDAGLDTKTAYMQLSAWLWTIRWNVDIFEWTDLSGGTYGCDIPPLYTLVVCAPPDNTIGQLKCSGLSNTNASIGEFEKIGICSIGVKSNVATNLYTNVIFGTANEMVNEGLKGMETEVQMTAISNTKLPFPQFNKHSVGWALDVHVTASGSASASAPASASASAPVPGVSLCPSPPPCSSVHTTDTGSGVSYCPLGVDTSPSSDTHCLPLFATGELMTISASTASGFGHPALCNEAYNSLSATVREGRVFSCTINYCAAQCAQNTIPRADNFHQACSGFFHGANANTGLSYCILMQNHDYASLTTVTQPIHTYRPLYPPSAPPIAPPPSLPPPCAPPPPCQEAPVYDQHGAAGTARYCPLYDAQKCVGLHPLEPVATMVAAWSNNPSNPAFCDEDPSSSSITTDTDCTPNQCASWCAFLSTSETPALNDGQPCVAFSHSQGTNSGHQKCTYYSNVPLDISNAGETLLPSGDRVVWYSSVPVPPAPGHPPLGPPAPGHPPFLPVVVAAAAASRASASVVFPSFEVVAHSGLLCSDSCTTQAVASTNWHAASLANDGICQESHCDPSFGGTNCSSDGTGYSGAPAPYASDACTHPSGYCCAEGSDCGDCGPTPAPPPTPAMPPSVPINPSSPPPPSPRPPAPHLPPPLPPTITPMGPPIPTSFSLGAHFPPMPPASDDDELKRFRILAVDVDGRNTSKRIPVLYQSGSAAVVPPSQALDSDGHLPAAPVTSATNDVFPIEMQRTCSIFYPVRMLIVPVMAQPASSVAFVLPSTSVSWPVGFSNEALPKRLTFETTYPYHAVFKSDCCILERDHHSGYWVLYHRPGVGRHAMTTLSVQQVTLSHQGLQTAYAVANNRTRLQIRETSMAADFLKVYSVWPESVPPAMGQVDAAYGPYAKQTVPWVFLGQNGSTYRLRGTVFVKAEASMGEGGLLRYPDGVSTRHPFDDFGFFDEIVTLVTSSRPDILVPYKRGRSWNLRIVAVTPVDDVFTLSFFVDPYCSDSVVIVTRRVVVRLIS